MADLAAHCRELSRRATLPFRAEALHGSDAECCCTARRLHPQPDALRSLRTAPDVGVGARPLPKSLRLSRDGSPLLVCPNGANDELAHMAAHPHLGSPQLFVRDVVASTTDAELMDALAVHGCLRARPVIDRSAGAFGPAQGFIEFEHMAKAEKALALIQGHIILGRDCTLSLSIAQPPAEDPIPPSIGTKLVVRQLPKMILRGELYDILRPHGPIYRCALQDEMRGLSTGVALVQFWDPLHARAALETLHLTTIGAGPGATQVTCTLYDPTVGPIPGLPGASSDLRAWTDAPAFIPRAPVGMPVAPPIASRARASSGATAALNSPLVMAAGAAAWRPATAVPGPPVGPNSVGLGLGMPSGLVSGPPPPIAAVGAPLILHNTGSNAPVDPCNLFIKNLEPSVSSQDLFSAFKVFGRIVSARVMRDERTGLSREFGFVSFSSPHEAANARQTMDGAVLLGSSGMGKEAVVRFHEPKNKRDSRGAHRLSAGQIIYPIESQMTIPLSQYEASPPIGSIGLVSAPVSRNVSSSSSSASPPPNVLPLPSTEQERMLAAVKREVADRARHGQFTELLMTLPKKERALCIFNAEILRVKLAEAKDVLDALDDDGETDIVAAVAAARISSSSSSSKRDGAAEPTQLPTPSATPRSSWASGIGTSSAPLPRAPSGGWTVAELAKLTAVDVIRLASASDPPPELAKPDAHVVAQQDAFFDNLLDRPANEQKQRLGERLFKILKGFSVPKASQKTIELLDAEDLRALCHLMVEQPEVLREKAQQPSSVR